MICVVATADEDQDFVDWLNACFAELNNDKSTKVCISWDLSDGSTVVNYHMCTYGELRNIAAAINDEATLRMIATNQDRIEKFVDELADDDAE